MSGRRAAWLAWSLWFVAIGSLIASMSVSAAMGSFIVCDAFGPVNVSGTPGAVEMNPVGVGGAAGQVFKSIRGGFGLVALALVLSLVSVVVRHRRADPTEREQLKWLLVAVALI